MIMAQSSGIPNGIIQRQCEDCQKPLNVDLLVYRSHDPELHFRLRMTEV